MVTSEMGIPSLEDKRSPPFPLLAKSISWIASRKRFVSREETSMRSASLSVRILRRQSVWRQKNFFTVSSIRIGRPAQGRSRAFLTKTITVLKADEATCQMQKRLIREIPFLPANQ